MRALLIEYLRPWKLATFGVGLALMLVGVGYYQVIDWDYTISIIMPTLTYLGAPFSVEAIRRRRWKQLPLALGWYYLAVDGSYWAYWQLVNPDALVMREANFVVSSCLYWMCGLIWLHKGPLRTLFESRRS